jgi:hypothetical protein
MTYSSLLHDFSLLACCSTRIQSGAVSRLQLEQWLQKDCREVLQLVDGAIMLDLLSMHTYGGLGKRYL